MKKLNVLLVMFVLASVTAFSANFDNSDSANNLITSEENIYLTPDENTGFVKLLSLPVNESDEVSKKISVEEVNETKIADSEDEFIDLSASAMGVGIF